MGDPPLCDGDSVSASSSLGFDPRVDYYAVLGVGSGAGVDEVKRAYRELARENHPDSTGGDRVKEERFKAVSQAYEVIGDADQRRRYDHLREGARSPLGGHGGTRGGESPFDVMMDLGDMLSEMFSADGTGRGRPSGGAQGGEPRPRHPAGAAAGTGSTVGGGKKPKGEPRRPRATGGVGGAGSVAGEGGGTARRRRSAGSAKSTAGAGPGPVPGSAVHGERRAPARARPSTQRMVAAIDGTPLAVEGADVLSESRLPFDRAIVGASIRISTLDGIVEVVVPPGTSSGRRLRLRGRGLPMGGAGTARWGARGDHYVTIHVDVPDDLDAEESGALAHLVGLLANRSWRRG
jgi:curved DNA-binding protein CbpA